MITSPNLLRKETVEIINQIDSLIEHYKEEAKRIDVALHTLCDSSGNLVLPPLLLAKVTAINTLVQLNQVVSDDNARKQSNRKRRVDG